MPRSAIAGRFARLVVTAVAAWLVFHSIDLSGLRQLLIGIDAAALALALPVLLVQFAVMTWRWQILTRLLTGITVDFGVLAVSLGRSMLIAAPLPSTIGGDIIRAALLSRSTGLGVAARSVVCDRIQGLLSLLVLVLVTIPLLVSRLDDGPALFPIVALSVLGLVGAGVLLSFPSALASMRWIGRLAGPVINDLRRAMAGREGAFAFILGLAVHLLGALLIYFLASAVAARITLADCLMLVPPMLFVTALPISLGGWGVREGALALGFGLIGAAPAAGVATSVLFGLTGPLLGLVTEMTALLVGRAGDGGTAGAGRD